MMKCSLSVLFWLFSGLVQAQQPFDSLVHYLPAKATSLSTDRLSQVYYLNNRNEVVKYQPSDGRTFTFSLKSLGKPAWIDASNPMQVLVLYPDVQTVVLLDSRLGPLTQIRLLATPDQHAYLPVAACAQPDDDFFWIFDGLGQQLVKLDERGFTVAASEPFLNLFNFTIAPTALYYQNETLFLYDAQVGMLQFDRFGSYIKTLNLATHHPIQVEKDRFLFVDNQQLVTVFTDRSGEERFALPQAATLSARLSGKYLITHLADGIYIWE